jgi:hypothetical protein
MKPKNLAPNWIDKAVNLKDQVVQFENNQHKMPKHDQDATILLIRYNLEDFLDHSRPYPEAKFKLIYFFRTFLKSIINPNFKARVDSFQEIEKLLAKMPKLEMADNFQKLSN